MKKYTPLLSLLLNFFLIPLLFSQVKIDHDPDHYAKKSAGQIPPPAQVSKPGQFILQNATRPSLGSSSGLLIPLDNTFTVAMVRNDDGFTDEMALQFNYQFYDRYYNKIYVNNNGNISFDVPYADFTSTGFPVNNFPMVAPFWADVDTRNSYSGLVYYKSEPHRFTVIWDHVGYYSSHADRLNTFELIITDGTDPLIGNGNNVAFCYEDMSWTTGDASHGYSGFGGTAATAGINRGNGINFAQIGRFDHEGTDHDGPYDSNDGVSYLDYKQFFFNTSYGQQVNYLSGRVLDDITLRPVINAAVSVAELNTSAQTDSLGSFRINVISNSLYNLTLSAAGYLSKNVNARISFNNLDLGDIYLTSIDTSRTLEVTELDLNPNKPESYVAAGGTCFRYYKVVDANGIGVNGIDVEFLRSYAGSHDNFTRPFRSQKFNGEDGILVVQINYDDVAGSRSTFCVKKVNYRPVSSAVLFDVITEPRSYSKAFEIKRELELGFGLKILAGGDAKVTDQSTPTITFENLTGGSSWDKLEIATEIESTAGVEFGTGGGFRLQAGKFGAGAYGGLEGGVFAILNGNASYKFDYETNSEEVKRARLGSFLLSYITLIPNPVLSRFAQVLGLAAYDDYVEETGAGIGVKGTGSADANLGFFTPRQIGLGLGAGANVSGSIGAMLHGGYIKSEQRFRAELSFFGDISANAQLGAFSWKYKNPGNPDFKTVNEIVRETKLGFSFFDYGFHANAGFEVKGDKGNGLSLKMSWSLENTITNKATRFSLFLPDVRIQNLINSSGNSSLFRSLSSISDPGAVISAMPQIKSSFLDENDGLLHNISLGQIAKLLPPFYYTVDSTLTGTHGSFGFSLDLGIVLDISFGLNLDWKTSRTACVREGVFLGGNKYVMKSNPSLPGDDNIPLDEIIKIFKEGLSTYHLSDFFSVLCFFCADNNSYANRGPAQDTTFIISPNGSKLRLSSSAIPQNYLADLRLLTWNWYGNSPSSNADKLSPLQKKIAYAIKKQQQQLSRLEYGIGGFYKFNPQPVPLLSPAVLTLVFPDSEVVGLNKSSLAIYYQNSYDKKWKYLGGAVDTLRNSVTVTITDSLQLYTIAPVMPDGIIRLKSSVDSVRYNGTEFSVTADSLKNSDGSFIGSGRYFTVTAENLDILSPDEDPSSEGVQVSSFDSRLSLQLKTRETVGQASVIVASVKGNSFGKKDLKIYNDTPPAAPFIRSVTGSDSKVRLFVVNPDTSQVYQYEVYFDNDSGNPYNGTALPGGMNSPFLIQARDTLVIDYLRNNTPHYFVLKAVDCSRNKSAYSNEVNVSPVDTIPPSPVEDVQITNLSGGSYLLKWTAPGDNGKDGIASSYSVRYSASDLADPAVWNNASVISGVTSPGISGSAEQLILRNMQAGYYVGIAVSDESGNSSPVYVFQLLENTVSRKMQVTKGWNLLSFPVRIYSTADQFPFISGKPFIFDSRTGYQVVDSVSNNDGFWVKAGLNYEKTFRGGKKDTVFTVKKGWNLFGPASDNVYVENIATAPAGLFSSFIWKFDSAGYSMTNKLEFSRGYWVCASDAGTVTFTRAAQSSKISRNLPDMSKGFDLVSVNGMNKQLFLTTRDQTSYFQVPPLSSGEIPDVRFNNMSAAEDESSSQYTLICQGLMYPVEIRVRGLNDAFQVYDASSGLELGLLSKKNPLSVRDEHIKQILLNRISVPADYYLDQNYPNPFNPRTAIQFGLPVDNKVTIKVYNILGEVVEVLMDKQNMHAGNQKIIWDAGRYASGVYFLRLEAGSFVFLRKMLLLK